MSFADVPVDCAIFSKFAALAAVAFSNEPKVVTISLNVICKFLESKFCTFNESSCAFKLINCSFAN